MKVVSDQGRVRKLISPKKHDFAVHLYTNAVQKKMMITIEKFMFESTYSESVVRFFF